MYLLTLYIPQSHNESVKQALFDAGAGKFNHYDQACWQTLGDGQFRPLENSNAFIGKPGVLENLPEYKVEVIVQDEYIHAVVEALKQAHPYEEPAYQVIKLTDISRRDGKLSL